MTPTGSWPMTKPGFTGYSPRTMWRSVPQIVVNVTRITASPTPAWGRFTSSTRMSSLRRGGHTGSGEFNAEALPPKKRHPGPDSLGGRNKEGVRPNEPWMDCFEHCVAVGVHIKPTKIHGWGASVSRSAENAAEIPGVCPDGFDARVVDRGGSRSSVQTVPSILNSCNKSAK